MKNGSPPLKRFYPEVTYVNATHILLAKSNLMTLANVTGLEGQLPHVSERRPEMLVNRVKVFLGFQLQKTLSFN